MVVLGGVPVELGLPPCLVPIALQEGVLVAVQVIHQVPVAAVLGDDVDGSWRDRTPASPCLGHRAREFCHTRILPDCRMSRQGQREKPPL